MSIGADHAGISRILTWPTLPYSETPAQQIWIGKRKVRFLSSILACNEHPQDKMLCLGSMLGQGAECVCKKCPGLKELTARSCHNWQDAPTTSQAQSSAAGPHGQEETRPPLSPTDEGIREAKRAITPGISAVTRAEAGTTAQNLWVKLIMYALEGTGDGGFKLNTEPNSYTLWS